MGVDRHPLTLRQAQRERDTAPLVVSLSNQEPWTRTMLASGAARNYTCATNKAADSAM